MLHKIYWDVNKFFYLKDTLKAFGDFKNKQKSIWSNVFGYGYSESVFNTHYTLR